MGAAERPQRERGGGEQAVGDRGEELARMQRRRERQRQDRPEHAGDAERQRGAEHEPDRDADRGERHDLGEVDREHARAGGAHRLEGGDHVALAVEIVLGRVGDADAADQQRGEADQGEILGEALDVALELRRRVEAAADVPAGVGQLRSRPPRSRGGCRRRRRARPAAPGSASAPGCRAASGRSRAAPPRSSARAARTRCRRRACRARR